MLYEVITGAPCLDESDKEFEWLDKAIESHDTGLAEIGSDILFANIRSDARWLPFLRRLAIAPDQLARIEFTVTVPAPTARQAAVV